MVFKRRDRRPIWRIVAETFWPRGGWRRAFHYIRHRLHRLPDPPHRIARGIFAGVFVSFTPLFGMHFVLAALLARVMGGNIVAALLATFVGNPLTFVAIATASFQTGHLLLGGSFRHLDASHRSLTGKFVDAWGDLKHNVMALFTDTQADWHNLMVFYDEVFLPYLVGGILVGLIAGLAAYYLSLPVIQAYQHRRKGLLRKKWLALRHKSAPDQPGETATGPDQRRQPTRRQGRAGARE
ncbi:MAG: DUF2062 domain-containing protein [Roseovarius sp.]